LHRKNRGAKKIFEIILNEKKTIIIKSPSRLATRIVSRISLFVLFLIFTIGIRQKKNTNKATTKKKW